MASPSIRGSRRRPLQRLGYVARRTDISFTIRQYADGLWRPATAERGLCQARLYCPRNLNPSCSWAQRRMLCGSLRTTTRLLPIAAGRAAGRTMPRRARSLLLPAPWMISIGLFERRLPTAVSRALMALSEEIARCTARMQRLWTTCRSAGATQPPPHDCPAHGLRVVSGGCTMCRRAPAPLAHLRLLRSCCRRPIRIGYAVPTQLATIRKQSCAMEHRVIGHTLKAAAL